MANMSQVRVTVSTAEGREVTSAWVTVSDLTSYCATQTRAGLTWTATAVREIQVPVAEGGVAGPVTCLGCLAASNLTADHKGGRCVSHAHLAGQTKCAYCAPKKGN